MNLTKLRAEKLLREITKHAEQNRYLLRRTQVYHDNAKGGDATAIMRIVRTLKEADDNLKQTKTELQAAMERKGWLA